MHERAGGATGFTEVHKRMQLGYEQPTAMVTCKGSLTPYCEFGGGLVVSTVSSRMFCLHL